ncbi:MAG TPA: hypothetical protein VN154_11660 [Rhizomicrobium sp.]|nr:hypothetical protein [Rhizomicrobium sp.]
MAKITVRHAAAAGYGLLFGRPLTVLGLTWLPAAVYAAVASTLVRDMSEAMAYATPAISGVAARYVFVYFTGLVVATAAFGALIAVPLTRQAFGLRDEPVMAHLVVGPREVRMFFALLRYYLLVACALVVLALVAGVVISQAVHAQIGRGTAVVLMDVTLETWLNSLAGMAAVLLWLAFAVRYGFFLDAVAAAEDRARLGRARGLARGNFVAVTLGTLLVGAPAVILLLACEMTCGGFGASGFAPASAVPFTIILTIGLVALHTLFAGASAGAYAEMADAVTPESEYLEAVQAREPIEEEPVYDGQPEPLFVRLAREASEKTHRPAEASGEQTLEVAAADGASETVSTFNWMAPPPDAHFGSDPHDAQHHTNEEVFETTAAMHAETADPVVDAQTKLAETAPLAGDVAALEQAARAAFADATAQIVGFDGHPTKVPDDAHHAEFPVPPLDPAGVIAAGKYLGKTQ